MSHEEREKIAAMVLRWRDASKEIDDWRDIAGDANAFLIRAAILLTLLHWVAS